MNTRDEASLARMREQRRRDLETIASLEAKIVRLQAQLVLATAAPEHRCEDRVDGPEVARAVRILADAFAGGRRS